MLVKGTPSVKTWQLWLHGIPGWPETDLLTHLPNTL